MEHLDTQNKFRKIVEGKEVYIEYSKVNEKRLKLTHTFVPYELRGKGAASDLVKEVLDYARENKITIIPMCRFVAAYLKRHPEYKDVL